MKISRDEASSREVVLNIELEPEDVEPYLDRAYQSVVKRVQIPGFRKGKATRPVLENFVGRDALLREALDFLVPDSLEKATKQEGIEEFAQPDIELTNLDPVCIKAVVPLIPEPDLGDFHNLRKQREPVLITEKQVDQVVDGIRDRATPWEPADRPVAFGDLVTLDLTGTVEGKEWVNDRAAEYIPRKDNPQPLPGFSIYLEGMSKDQEKEFTLPVPEDYQDTSLAGKECKFRLKMISLKEKHLPELDDDLAKSIGEGYESLSDMRTKIREGLTLNGERMSRQRFQETLLDEVVKGAQVEVSPILVEREIEHLLNDQEQALKDRRTDMDAYLQQVGKSKEEIIEEMRPHAQERLQHVLVLRGIAKKESIEVTPQDVDAEVAKMISATGESGKKLQRAFSSPNGRSSLSNSILRRRVLERLEEIATQEESSKEIQSDDIDSHESQDEGGNSAT